MATLASTADFICEQMGGAGVITSKRMFGEYAVYVNGKVIAFICDDSLFIKPTAAAKEFFPEAEDAPAYPGSKMYMLIPEEKWEDSEFMSELASISFNALPAPKAKKT
jgi:DNA transformation protein and related proteins